MIEYRGEVTLRTNGQGARPTNIVHRSGYYDTKEQVKKWFGIQRDCMMKGDKVIKERTIMSEINMTDNEDVAKKEGYKSFGVTIWEECKYYKQYWAKDKEAMETDDATEIISNDFSDGHFEWCKGSEDWEIDEVHQPIPVKENK